MCLCILLPFTTVSVLLCYCDIVYPYFRGGGVMCATDEESVRVVNTMFFIENIFCNFSMISVLREINTDERHHKRFIL